IVSEYAITTDCMRNGNSPRLVAIAGSAVLTMVESSVCMKKPVATSHSITVRDFWEGVFAIWAVDMESGGGAGGAQLGGPGSRHFRGSGPSMQILQIQQPMPAAGRRP